MLLIFNAEKGRRQDATLRDPHLLLVQLGKSGTDSKPEGTFRQEALNKPGEVAPETEMPGVRGQWLQLYLETLTSQLCREFNLFLRTSLHPSHTTDA